MNFDKLKPWNWFKHEEPHSGNSNIPVKREAVSGKSVPSNRREHSILQLHEEMNRLFDEAFGDFMTPFSNSSLTSKNRWALSNKFHPQLNISNDRDNYEVTLEAPGMNQEEISVELKDDVLTISGHKEEKKEDKDRHYYRVERSYGAFQRILNVPDDAQKDAIQANMKDGLLTISIPRKPVEESGTKKIEISE